MRNFFVRYWNWVLFFAGLAGMVFTFTQAGMPGIYAVIIILVLALIVAVCKGLAFWDAPFNVRRAIWELRILDPGGKQAVFKKCETIIPRKMLSQYTEPIEVHAFRAENEPRLENFRGAISGVVCNPRRQKHGKLFRVFQVFDPPLYVDKEYEREIGWEVMNAFVRDERYQRYRFKPRYPIESLTVRIILPAECRPLEAEFGIMKKLVFSKLESITPYLSTSGEWVIERQISDPPQRWSYVAWLV